MFLAINKATFGRAACIRGDEAKKAKAAKNHKISSKIARAAEVVTGIALVAIGLLAFRGAHVGLSPSIGILVATAGGGVLAHLTIRFADDKISKKEIEGDKKIKDKKIKDTTSVTKKVVMSLLRIAALTTVVLGVLGMTRVLPFSSQLSYALVGAGGSAVLLDVFTISASATIINKMHAEDSLLKRTFSYFRALWY